MSMITRTLNPLLASEFGRIDFETVADDRDFSTPRRLRAEIFQPPSGGGGPPHPMPLRHFKALGTGEVGDKVRQLDEAQPALTAVGLATPPGNVITEDRLIPILRRLGLGNSLAEADQHPDASAKIKAAGINSDDAMWLLAAMEDMPRGLPIIVRSSAVDDAEGSGTYESFFVPGNAMALGQAVLDVLASYFTEDARTFRALCGVRHGLGILVMPAIVQKFPTIIPNTHPLENGPDLWAPIISGSGVTSNSTGEPEIYAVPGLGGGVSSGYPELLTPSRLAQHNGDFFRYLIYEHVELWEVPGRNRISALLRSDVTVEYAVGPKRDYSAMGLVALADGILGTVSSRIILNNALLKAIPLQDFFNALQALEQRLGYRAYVEWAVRVENGKPRFTILQIARADLKGGIIDFDAIPNPIFSGHSVYGSVQNKTCPAIAYCSSLWDMDKLRDFDAAHPEGYVLLYNASLKYNQVMGNEGPLTISVIPNATAVIEIQDQVHARPPISHWAGQIEKTGKVFAVMADTTHLPEELRAKMTPHSNGGLLVYERPVVVNASAQQNKMVVSEGAG